MQSLNLGRPSEQPPALHARDSTLADIIGANFWDDFDPDYPDCGTNANSGEPGFMLTRVELDLIRDEISKTIRPTWQTPPPASLGSASHGKLKADEYRAVMEFDLPATLIRLGASDRICDPRRREFIRKLAHSTALLSIALRWATSHRTSPKHARMYSAYMVAYLSSITELYPTRRLRPNHHAALHLADFFLAFGPVHGWWMFPFERLIGMLQKINTNYKSGAYSVNPLA